MPERPPYEVEAREVVAESPELKVVILTLAPGQAVPWHYHSHITDTFFCLEGPMVIRTRGGKRQTELAAGQRYDIPPRTAHHVSGKEGGRCKFALVQGVGAYDFVPVEVE